MTEQDDALLAAFAHSLAGHDPKTIRTYLSGLKGLTQQPAGKPFRTEILTETAIEGSKLRGVY